MSSKQLANTTTSYNTFNGEKNTGLMVTGNATVDPYFNRASKVFIAYCSSDSHAGNRTITTANGQQLHFRGKEIVRAVIAELMEQHALGEAQVVVLTGGSAGGMATLNNGDYVAQLLPSSPTRKYVAYADAGVFMDVMPNRVCDRPDQYECKCAAGSGCGIVTLADQMQKMLAYTGGLPDRSCAAAYGKWGAWRCYLGQYAWPHLSETFLLNQMQTDEWQAFWNGFTQWNNKSEPEEREYALWFRRTVDDSLRSIDKSNVHVFSPNCVVHTFTYDPHWWKIQVDGWSSRDAIGALISSNRSLPRLVIDDCIGLSCSVGCPQPPGTRTAQLVV